ncbi:murein hydrolase activator EnvC family protein [Proteiniphilum sp. UBA5384]|uniref:murein hydrolase activator EnvC family protein n=1 Tax=Proteiniphilum sp. UBA5384 TaxID=1947279 RepID=UPI0025CDDBF7|nr:peptidoglycan DD-metalloendopeptidase family protein [Proteiniphilum sp. UBA5384]
MKKVVFLLLFHTFAFFLLSQTTGEIERLQRQQQALMEEIRNTNKLYLDVKRQTTTILDRINLINKQIAARKELIDTQKNEIEALRKEEIRLENEIARLNKELEKKRGYYADAMKGMLNHKFSQNKLLFILSGKSVGESLRRMQYLKEYSKWQKLQAEEIKSQHAEIKQKQELLSKAKADKEKALASLQSEQQKLEGEEKTQQSEMEAARGQQQQLQKTLREKQQRVDQLNSRIEKLIAEEVARQEREAEARRKAEEAARRKREEEKRAEDRRKGKSSEEKERTETSTTGEERSSGTEARPRIEHGSAAIDETFHLSKDFAANKGKLPMPVTGTAAIVGYFGTKKHDEWNVTTNSNGIDVQAERGANIRSVFEGEVSKVFSFPGSNTCVIVRHGDYYTFYANIYDLFVKQGDKVKTGQSLGRIFTDPDTGVSTMHFQLWQKTNKLNPAPWLQR